ncbi:MAG: hypothetical protein JO020_08105 [Chloroflexi bacterium]|nr:hypothetical protein [Chloroflexota bacterium]
MSLRPDGLALRLGSAPRWLNFQNEYYSSEREYVLAAAWALNPEYRAIVDAGLLLHLDDPGIAMGGIAPRSPTARSKTTARWSGGTSRRSADCGFGTIARSQSWVHPTIAWANTPLVCPMRLHAGGGPPVIRPEDRIRDAYVAPCPSRGIRGGTEHTLRLYGTASDPPARVMVREVVPWPCTPAAHGISGGNIGIRIRTGLASRLLVLALALSLIGADLAQADSASDTVAQLPNLNASYAQYEGADLTQSGRKFADLVEQIVPTGPADTIINSVGGMAQCAQDKGIFAWRVYQSRVDNLAWGTAAVVSESLATPQTILGCVLSAVMGGGGPEGGGESTLSPCSQHGRYSSTSDTYLWFYAATKTSVCSDLQSAFDARAIGLHQQFELVPGALGTTPQVLNYGVSEPGAQCDDYAPGGLVRNRIFVNPPVVTTSGFIETQYQASLLAHSALYGWQPQGGIGEWLAPSTNSAAGTGTFWQNLPPGQYAAQVSIRWHAFGQPYSQTGNMFVVHYVQNGQTVTNESCSV